MRWILVMIAVVCLCGCSVNASKVDSDYAKEFAENVRCAKGYAGGCWCFVASRKTGSVSTTGIGMALAPKEFCK